MTWKNRNWHGPDASNKESLFEYGLLMRWVPKWQTFQVITIIGFDEEGNRLYSYGLFDFEDTWNELPEERKQEIYRMCGMTEQEYMECLSPVGLVNDLLALMSVYDVISISAYEDHMTEKMIRKNLGRALCA